MQQKYSITEFAQKLTRINTTEKRSLNKQRENV